MKKKGIAYIGTSGWSYKHWIGPFYPEGIKDNEELSFYQQYFGTVELNNSFYNLPLIKTFKHWKEIAPQGFIYAVKASRYITHMKKLKVEKSSLNKFFTRVNKLEDELGPILFQLPPKWNVNAERLEAFLQKLPDTHRYTFEFRNATWFNDQVYALLKKYNCAFCIYELAGYQSPEETTTDFVYIRLHGPGAKYQGNYTKPILKKWTNKIKHWLKDGRDVYLYFDNDSEGFAVLNAQTLQQLIAPKSAVKKCK